MFYLFRFWFAMKEVQINGVYQIYEKASKNRKSILTTIYAQYISFKASKDRSVENTFYSFAWSSIFILSTICFFCLCRTPHTMWKRRLSFSRWYEYLGRHYFRDYVVHRRIRPVDLVRLRIAMQTWRRECNAYRPYAFGIDSRRDHEDRNANSETFIPTASLIFNYGLIISKFIPNTFLTRSLRWKLTLNTHNWIIRVMHNSFFQKTRSNE